MSLDLLRMTPEEIEAALGESENTEPKFVINPVILFDKSYYKSPDIHAEAVAESKSYAGLGQCRIFQTDEEWFDELRSFYIDIREREGPKVDSPDQGKWNDVCAAEIGSGECSSCHKQGTNYYIFKHVELSSTNKWSCVCRACFRRSFISRSCAKAIFKMDEKELGIPLCFSIPNPISRSFGTACYYTVESLEQLVYCKQTHVGLLFDMNRIHEEFLRLKAEALLNKKERRQARLEKLATAMASRRVSSRIQEQKIESKPESADFRQKAPRSKRPRDDSETDTDDDLPPTKH